MPPSVAPTSQVRRPIASSGRKRGRNFDNLHPKERRLHHHLAREFHPGSLQVHAAVRLHAEATQSAVEVSAGGMKTKASQKTQHRIAKVSVQKRHRAFLNAP